MYHNDEWLRGYGNHNRSGYSRYAFGYDYEKGWDQHGNDDRRERVRQEEREQEEDEMRRQEQRTYERRMEKQQEEDYCYAQQEEYEKQEAPNPPEDKR